MKNKNGMNKLAFTKAAVIELNDQKLTEVNGGTFTTFMYELGQNVYEWLNQ